MRKTTVILWSAAICLSACQMAEEEKDAPAAEKTCACHEPNALNAVSIDFPPELVMDRIVGDSVQNQTTYRINHDFVELIVRCGDCDSLDRKKSAMHTLIPPVLRHKGQKSLRKTQKFEGAWYEEEITGKWNCEFFLAGKGPKHWYVQISAQNVDSSTVRIIHDALPTLEIREKAYAN